MEELNYEEQLKYENTKEHMKVVLSNVRIASDTLSKLLKNIEDASAKLYSIEKKAEEINNICNEKESFISEKLIALENKEKLINQREEKVNNKEIEVLEKIDTAQNKLSEIFIAIDIANSRYEDITTKNKKELFELTEKIKNTKIKLDDLCNSEDKLKEELYKLERLKSKIIVLIEEENKKFENIKSIHEQELSEIEYKINIERKKIKNPLLLLKTEQDKLSILKDDLRVIQARLTQQFKQQNPEKNLPIELKQEV